MPRSPASRLACLLLAGACVARPAAPTVPDEVSRAIGFAVHEGDDMSRRYGAGARRLRVGIWYPATGATSTRLTLAAYDRLLTRDVASAPTILPGHRDAPMSAVLGAPPTDGPTPLVVYLPGFGANPTVHALACERLAARGYAVAAMASMAPTPVEMTFDIDGVEAQRRDVEWSIVAAEQRLGRSFSQIALIGVSFGSLAGWRVLTGGDERMVALVSLDGSLGFVDGAELMAANPPTRPARQAVLHINVAGNGYNDVSYLEDQPFALVQTVSLADIHHNEFFPGRLYREEPTGAAAADARRKLDTVLGLAVGFIDLQLAGRRACVAWTGASTCRRPRVDVPAESTTAAMLADAGGRAQLAALGRRARDAGITRGVVREGLLEAVAHGADAQTALAVTRLRVLLFPDSYRALWDLGVALEEAGDIDGAIAAYEGIQRKNPRVRDAADEIRRLRATKSP